VTRLLVVRLGSLGDLVHALPAVAALRRAHPAAEIDWLVDAAHREFLELVPVVSSLVVLREQTARAWLEVRRELRGRHYDAAIDFQGLLKSAALARLSGARRVVGFDRGSLRERSAAPFYTERVETGEGQHVIEKNLRLARALGAEPGPHEFPLAPVRSAPVDAVVAQAGAPLALVNPGAAWPNKRWPVDRFARIAVHVRARHGLAPLVLWGPGEIDLARAIAHAAGGVAIVAPETRLPDLVAAARAARLIVSGDTGPLHIAAAVGVPAVALFGPTNPRRNGPWQPSDLSLTRYESCDCHYERRCRRDASGWCLGTITVDEVIDAIDRRLSAAAAADAPDAGVPGPTDLPA
jgi:lipopolysaccharide heptosyltransferase I